MEYLFNSLCLPINQLETLWLETKGHPMVMDFSKREYTFTYPALRHLHLANFRFNHSSSLKFLLALSSVEKMALHDCEFDGVSGPEVLGHLHSVTKLSLKGGQIK